MGRSNQSSARGNIVVTPDPGQAVNDVDSSTK